MPDTMTLCLLERIAALTIGSGWSPSRVIKWYWQRNNWDFNTKPVSFSSCVMCRSHRQPIDPSKPSSCSSSTITDCSSVSELMMTDRIDQLWQRASDSQCPICSWSICWHTMCLTKPCKLCRIDSFFSFMYFVKWSNKSKSVSTRYSVHVADTALYLWYQTSFYTRFISSWNCLHSTLIGIVSRNSTTYILTCWQMNWFICKNILSVAQRTFFAFDNHQSQSHWTFFLIQAEHSS